MARSKLIAAPPPALTIDEALALVRAHMEREVAGGKMGERLVSWNLNERREITHVSAGRPLKLQRLSHSCLTESAGEA